jgi:Mrp family chromosome partitioning ATPase
MALEQKPASTSKLEVIRLASRPHADADSTTRHLPGVRIRVDRVPTAAPPRFDQLASAIEPPADEPGRAGTAARDSTEMDHPEVADVAQQDSTGVVHQDLAIVADQTGRVGTAHHDSTEVARQGSFNVSPRDSSDVAQPAAADTAPQDSPSIGQQKATDIVQQNVTDSAFDDSVGSAQPSLEAEIAPDPQPQYVPLPETISVTDALSEPYYASETAPEATALCASEPVPDPHAALTAAFQVDQLLWPDLCTKLGSSGVAQFDQLADALLGPDRREHRVVAVAGSGPGAGSTTLLLCLARHLVQGGLKVAVVDADCRSPALAQSVGLAIEVGWEQVLQGIVPLEEVIVESLADKLAIVPRVSALALDALSALRMEENLNRLRERYEVLLLDWGALEDPADAETLRLLKQAARADRVLLVHDVRQPNGERLAVLAQQFDAATVAVVENFAAQ